MLHKGGRGGTAQLARRALPEEAPVERLVIAHHECVELALGHAHRCADQEWVAGLVGEARHD
mgnify:CR=1 FL=1